MEEDFPWAGAAVFLSAAGLQTQRWTRGGPVRRESPGSLLPSLQLKRLLRAEGRVVRGLDHPQTPLPAQKAGGPAALSKHQDTVNGEQGASSGQWARSAVS